jgi:hypothetical protein
MCIVSVSRPKKWQSVVPKKKKRPTQKKGGEGMERREGVGDPRAEGKIFYLATASGARDLGKVSGGCLSSRVLCSPE